MQPMEKLWYVETSNTRAASLYHGSQPTLGTIQQGVCAPPVAHVMFEDARGGLNHRLEDGMII